MYYFFGVFSPNIREESFRRPGFIYLLCHLLKRQLAATPGGPGALLVELCIVPSRGSCAFGLVKQVQGVNGAISCEGSFFPTLCAKGNVLQDFFFKFFFLTIDCE